MFGQLTALNGPLQGAVFPLPQRGMFLLGKCLYSDIQLADFALGSYHCAFVRGTDQDEDQFLVIDLHTEAGTRVNDVRITQAKLQTGSIIAAGDSKLRFDILATDSRGPVPLPPDGAMALLDAQDRERRRAKAALQSGVPVRARLRCLSGVAIYKDLDVHPASPTYFGRTRNADVVLTDSGASQHQALIAYDMDSGRFLLYDLHTTNGTMVNDEAINVTALRDRDVIEMGSDVRLAFSERGTHYHHEKLEDTRELTSATMVIPRGKKKIKRDKKESTVGSFFRTRRRRGERTVPDIHETDTGAHEPVNSTHKKNPSETKTPKKERTKKPRKRRLSDETRKGVPVPVVEIALASNRFSESYRTLRTNLGLTTAEGLGRCIVVTSPGPQEGKTCVAVNLAIAAANVGLKVLLLEGDLRRSRLHRVFSLKSRPGLVNYLAKPTQLNGHVKATDFKNLFVLPRGSRCTNPTELLNSELLAELLEDLRETYDLIIVDSPPMLSVADPSVLAPLTDGYLMVLRSCKTPREAAKRAIQQIERVGGTILGAVLNDVNPKKHGYPYYYYNNYAY